MGKNDLRHVYSWARKEKAVPVHTTESSLLVHDGNGARRIANR
jgi:hypothetical protein